MGHTAGNSFSDIEKASEFSASASTLPIRQANKGFCWCIFLWNRRSAAAESGRRGDTSLLCVQISDQHRTEICPSGKRSACNDMVLREVCQPPEFIIETDHKPLLGIMKKKRLDELTPRLQRFKMRISHIKSSTHRGRTWWQRTRCLGLLGVFLLNRIARRRSRQRCSYKPSSKPSPLLIDSLRSSNITKPLTTSAVRWWTTARWATGQNLSNRINRWKHTGPCEMT